MSALLSLTSVQDLFALIGHDRLRLVGGCVRDTLIGVAPSDLDACTPLKPEQTLALIEGSTAFSAYATGLQHGTITAVHLPSATSIEVTTLREDVATDGRHATVAFTNSWAADAARRDFTFNALSLDYDGKVHDYFGGRADLAAGQVRFIGDPKARLDEDWLRALRYFRFWGRFGAALPTQGERAALIHAATHLGRLSVERIWVELKRLVQTPKAHAALNLFQDLGYDKALGLHLRRAAFEGLDPVAAWAGLLSTESADVLARFKASRAEQAYFAAVQSALGSAASRFERQVRFGHGATVAAEHLRGQPTDFAPPPDFPVRAQDLIDLGHVPGPAMGQTLRQLQDHWIAGAGQAGAEDLLAWLTKSQT